MSHLAYAAVLLGCLLGAGWLEVYLHTGVFRRWRRLLLTLLPVLVVFVAWDTYAVARHQWSFDQRYVSGWRLGRLPVEEIAFFVVIPICSVLAFEAVRRVSGWHAGDEGPPAPSDAARNPDGTPGRGHGAAP